jgi:predicted AAA+ superfamily ATPase
MNPHWNNITPLKYNKKREIFQNLVENLANQQICFLVGARRSGKSVLLEQLLDYLLVSKIQPTQILFYEFSANENSQRIWEILDIYKTKVGNLEQNTYLFFDEIQYLPNFEIEIKLIYDRFPNLKIFLTGSLSLSYKRKMEESLAGRIFVYKTLLLNFREYLDFSSSENLNNFDKLKTEIKPFQSKLIIDQLLPEFNTFLTRGRYPELAIKSTLEPKQYLESILNQSLNQDAINYFQVQKPNLLRNLFDYFVQNSGLEASVLNISQVASADRETVQKYIDVLELLGLIYILPNSQNPLKVSQTKPKIYTSSIWVNQFDPNHLQKTGFIMESYVLERLLGKNINPNFYRDRNNEIDFVNWREKKAFEVKYRLNTNIREIEKYSKLSEKLGLKTKILNIYPESENQESVLGF